MLPQGVFQFVPTRGTTEIFHMRVSEEIEALIRRYPEKISFLFGTDSHTLSIGSNEFFLFQKQEKDSTITVVDDSGTMQELGTCRLKLHPETDIAKTKERVKQKFQEQEDERSHRIAEENFRGTKRGAPSNGSRSKKLATTPMMTVLSDGIVAPPATVASLLASGKPRAPSKLPLREIILHNLALKKMSMNQLRDACNNVAVAEIKAEMRDICSVVAPDTYCLIGDAFKFVNPNWPGYTAEQQAAIKQILEQRKTNSSANCQNGSATSELRFTPWQLELVEKLQGSKPMREVDEILSDSEAIRVREDFQRKYQVYKMLDDRLNHNKREFDVLRQKWETSIGEEKNSCQKKIENLFFAVKEETQRYYRAFMALHEHLSAQKSALRKYENGAIRS